MQMRRGHADRNAHMTGNCGVVHHASSAEEKRYLEEVVKRLGEELQQVKDRIEKLDLGQDKSV